MRRPWPTCLACARAEAVPNPRDRFGALIHTPRWVRALCSDVEASGVYTTGIESDKRNRGSSINVDVYGYDPAQGLAVIQVRECVFRPNRYSRVHKDYYLIGRLEGGQPFAHPIQTPARSKRALASPEACVRYIQAKLWGCDEDELDEITRQGDVALVPAVLPRDAEELDEREVVVADSHRVLAERIWVASGIYYVRHAVLKHLPGQHATVRQPNGIRRVVVAPRARTWGFSAPTAD
jgi:hypothetical protein